MSGLAETSSTLPSTSAVHLVVVPHTHWDREWYQPFQEFRVRLVRLVERLLTLLATDPAFSHFHFDGQTIVLEDYLDICPDRRARLRQCVRAGRLAVGPWYVLPDEFLVSGESLIRNLQVGHRIAAAFGGVTSIGYLPDEFGHCAQMPQILAGFGIESAVVWRGVGADVTETLFRWEAPDGSAVVAVYLPLSGYSNGRNLPVEPSELREHLGRIIAEQAPFRRIPSLLVLNGTDHQEAQAEVPAALAAATRGLEGVTYEIAPLARFIARARGEHGMLQVHRGELRSAARTTVTPGVTSVRSQLKQRDFDTVGRLERYAEPLATWADLLAEPGAAGERHGPLLDWAWKLALQNHPHDSITGCSVDQVHRDMESRFDQVQLVVDRVLSQALAALMDRLDTSNAAPDGAVVVYNPNAAGANVIRAELHLDVPPGSVLLDEQGRELPLHVETSASETLLDAELPPEAVRPHVLALHTPEFLGMAINELRLNRQGDSLAVDVTLDRLPRARLEVARLRREWLAHLDDPGLRTVSVRAKTGAPAQVAFCAPALTAHGFTVFSVRRSENANVWPFPAAADALENSFFRVQANADGSLTIVDKETGLHLPRCNWLVDEGDRGDEYNFDAVDGQQVRAPLGPPSVTVDTGNPVVATMTVTQRYAIPRRLETDRETRSAELVTMAVSTVVRLYAGVKRVDFETTIDNVAADHRLRVHFTTPLVVASAFMEQAFATVERPLALEPESPFEKPVGTVPQKTFTAVEDGCLGVAIFNRGIPEVEVCHQELGAEIAMTLIRSVGWLSRGDLRSRNGPAGPGLETPEAQSAGVHRFEYALTTYRGDWQSAGIVAQAHAFAFPPLAAVTDAHPGALASETPLVECDNPHVVLSAVTAARRPGTFIARWYNSAATRQTATIGSPLAVRARTVDLLERARSSRTSLRRVTAARWRIELRPFEIVTVQLRTA